MKRKILVLMLVFCMVFSNIAYAAPSQKTLQGSSYKHLKGFMNRFEKSKFSSIVKLGTISTYRTELSDVKVVVNTTMKANAMYDPVSNTLYLSKDPSKVSASQSLSMGETIWHELTHKIEGAHNDIGTFDSKEYGERNIEYMTYIVGVALPVLQQMENDKKADSAKIQKYWDIFIKRMEAANKLPEVVRYPADLKLMEEWFGFKVDPALLESFYQKGGAGSKIASALTPAASFTWGGVWQTNFNEMNLTQTGNSVSGPYAYHKGRIEATANGKTLTGRWIEYDNEGTFTLTMSDDGKSFSGSWVETKPNPGGGGAWTGSRKN